MRPVTDSMRRVARRASQEWRTAVWLVVVLWVIAALVLYGVAHT
jgi:hypothetical protein